MQKLSPLKLVDESILPVVLIISSKLFSVFLISIVFGISWDIKSTEGAHNLYFLNFTNLSDLFFVNSLSDLAMVLATATGFVWVLFRGSYFGEENLHPINASRLHKSGKQYLIVKSHEMYHQATVWLSLSWLTLFIIFSNVTNGVTNQINLGISLVATLGLTITLWENLRKIKY